MLFWVIIWTCKWRLKSALSWLFESVMCRIHSLVSLINLYASTTFLVVLSFDRYLCLVYPVKSRYYRTMKNALISILVCWAIVLTICLIQIQFRQLMMRQRVQVNGSRPEFTWAESPPNVCTTMWSVEQKQRCFCMWNFPSDQASQESTIPFLQFN